MNKMMEDIAEILMTISKNAALYSELPHEKEVKKTLIGKQRRKKEKVCVKARRNRNERII